MATALFDPIVRAPRWRKVVLGLVGLVALGGAGYYFLLSPIERRVEALRLQRAAQQQEIKRLQALAADLVRVRREAAAVERKLEIAKAKLPNEREMPTLYRALSDTAARAGLAVALFQPQGPRVRDFYSEIPIALVAEGGYHEMGDFVGRLAALSRATTIGEFKLKGLTDDPARRRPSPARPQTTAPIRTFVDEGNARSPAAVEAAKKSLRSLRAEITLLTYVYRPEGSPPAPKPAAPKPEAAKP